MKTIIKRYPKARLETCGQKRIGKSFRSHANGCYIRLNNNETKHSSGELWIIVDFDKNDEICALEFVDGLPFKSKRRKK